MSKVSDEIFAQACALNKRAKEQLKPKEDNMRKTLQEMSKDELIVSILATADGSQNKIGRFIRESEPQNAHLNELIDAGYNQLGDIIHFLKGEQEHL